MAGITYLILSLHMSLKASILSQMLLNTSNRWLRTWPAITMSQRYVAVAQFVCGCCNML